MRALVVENDRVSSLELSTILQKSRLVVDAVDTAQEAIELSKYYDYDVILLNLILPDLDGLELIRRVRSSRSDTPIVVVSAPCKLNEKVRALNGGADDYVERPFDEAELRARMLSVIRRHRGLSQSEIRVGSLKINLDRHEATVDDKIVPLTGKEFAILELLAVRRGMVLSKETFLNHLYGGVDEPEMKIIDVFICKLRKKLSVLGADGLIATVWGRGYMLRDASRQNQETTTQEMKTYDRYVFAIA